MKLNLAVALMNSTSALHSESRHSLAPGVMTHMVGSCSYAFSKFCVGREILLKRAVAFHLCILSMRSCSNEFDLE